MRPYLEMQSLPVYLRILRRDDPGLRVLINEHTGKFGTQRRGGEGHGMMEAQIGVMFLRRNGMDYRPRPEAGRGAWNRLSLRASGRSQLC